MIFKKMHHDSQDRVDGLWPGLAKVQGPLFLCAPPFPGLISVNWITMVTDDTPKSFLLQVKPN